MPPKRRGSGAVTRAQTKQHARKSRPASVRPATDMSREKPSFIPEEPENKTCLIELATFPGYTPSQPTPLPQSLDTLEQMRRVTRAQPRLATQREGFREYWRENFYSTASQTIFLDTFWWFFLERYQPHQAVQSSLFSRVAENYVTFLARTEIHAWKDKFLKAYPDALAQCVYTAFIHAFPASWSSFDHNFKSALVELVHLWQTGTRPMPELWRRWNFKHLDPPDSLKTIGEENEQVRQKKTFDLGALVEEARASVKEDTPSIIELHSGRKQGADGGLAAAVHPSSEGISRDDLEEVLSGKRLQGQLVEGGGDEVTPSSVVGSKLDLARSQYISLCERRGSRDRSGSHNDRGKLQAGGTCQRSVNAQSRHPNQALPFKSAGLPHKVQSKQSSTLCVPTPLPPRGPNKTTGNQNSQPQPLPRSQNGSISTLKPPTGAAAGRTQQAVRPNQRANVKSTGGRTAKGARTHTGKVQTFPTRGTPKASSTGDKRGHASTTEKERTPPVTRKEKPAGSSRPVSAAEEYGLPNYIFEEGESSWKEKAVAAREKTQNRPINVLKKLHRNQGVPLAVPEMESVCFNQFGRSPLVKHYLQKKRLHKVTGYSILTKRTELNQVIPSGIPTYEDVIRDSLKESREQSVRLSSQRRQTKKQLQIILQERMKKREVYKQQLRQLLSTQKEVESLSNELVAYWQQRGVDRQEGVASLKRTLSPDMQRTLSSCINQAFQRCSTHSSP